MRSVNRTVNVCSDNTVAVNTGAPMDANGCQWMLAAAAKMSRRERLSRQAICPLSRGISGKYNCEEAAVLL